MESTMVAPCPETEAPEPRPAPERKVYYGIPPGLVQVCELPSESIRALEPRHDLLQKPAGVRFEWGSVGAGSTHLALAILADLLPPQRSHTAMRRCGAFAAEILTRWSSESSWSIADDEIREWLRRSGEIF